MWCFRWWKRAPRSFAEWRSVLLRLRKGAAKIQWTCRRHSLCISSKHGEKSTPLSHCIGSAVGWTKMFLIYICLHFPVLALFNMILPLPVSAKATQKNCPLLRPMDAVAEGCNPAPDSLWRRYSEFELLRNYLIVTYPYIVVPPLPEKRVSSFIQTLFSST